MTTKSTEYTLNGHYVIIIFQMGLGREPYSDTNWGNKAVK
jgi:hypothetical protein